MLSAANLPDLFTPLHREVAWVDGLDFEQRAVRPTTGNRKPADL